MTALGETPTALWEPVIPPTRHLGGVPSAIGTAVDFDSIVHLASAHDPLVWGEPRGVFVIEGEAELAALTRPIRVQVRRDGAPFLVVDSSLDGMWFRRVDQPEGDVIDAFERCRASLGLRAVDAAKLLGLSNPRRYYELREHRRLPAERADDIRYRTTAIANLARRDPEGMRELVRNHPDEFTKLLGERRFQDLVKLMASVWKERIKLHALAHPPKLMVEPEAASEIEAVVTQPGFAKAIDALAGLVPATQSSIPERLLAWARLERNIRAADEGEDVDAPWDFLPVIKRAEIDGLRERAEARLREDVFTDDRWRAFAEAESERAWAAYDPGMSPPDDEVVTVEATGPGVLPGWELDLTAFGSPRRYSDRYGR